MAPRSLAEMSLTVAIHNINHISSLNGMTESQKDALYRVVTKADQLRLLEEEDDLYEGFPEQWQRLIQADFPELARSLKWAPKDPKHWSRVYFKYKKTNDDNLAAATEALAAKFRADDQKSEAQKRRFKENLQKRLPPPPSDRPGKKGHWSNTWVRKSAIGKLRSQVKSQAIRFKPPPSTLAGHRLGHVDRAPEIMIREARVTRQPEVRAGRAMDGATITGHMSFNNEPFNRARVVREQPCIRPNILDDRGREVREERLRQIKAQGAAPRPEPNVLDLESDDESSSKSKTTNSTRRSPPLSAAPRGTTTSRTNEPSTAPPGRRRTGLLSAAPGANGAVRVSRPRASVSPPVESKKRTFSESVDDTNDDSTDDLFDSPKRRRTDSPPDRTGRLPTNPGINKARDSSAATARMPSSQPSGTVKREKSPEDVKASLDKLRPAPPPRRKRPVSCALVAPKRNFH